MAASEVIRRKIELARAAQAEGGPGADRGWRLSLARAARDVLKLPLEVAQMRLDRVELAEVLELPPEMSFLAVLEGPGEGLGLLAISPPVLQAMIEVQTIGRIGAAAPSPRKPTRTDAAMVAGLVDAALLGLEAALAQEADLIWAGGFRYASFLDDPRPLGLMLEDCGYRVLAAEISVAGGARRGPVILALPAEGRGQLPAAMTAPPAEDELAAGHAFMAALAEQVGASPAQLDAVLSRVTLPLAAILSLQPGQVLALGGAQIDKISFEGVDGRRLAEGRLGQNRGLRAIRLTAAAVEATGPRSAGHVVSEEETAAVGLRQAG